MHAANGGASGVPALHGRQLINKALVSLRPSWLSEPRGAADVGWKLLVDLKHLLPPPPATTAPSPPAAVVQAAAEAEGAVAAAAPAEGAIAPDAVAAQSSPQFQDQVHKLLVLLSCLVAILKAMCDTPGSHALVSNALEFIETAHSRVSAHAAAGVASRQPDSSWSAAATSLAGSMLALWEAVVSQPAGQGDTSAVAVEGSSKDGSSSSSTAETASVQQPDAADPAAAQEGIGSTKGAQPIDPASTTPVRTAARAIDLADMSQRTWALVLATLKLPLLPVEDAVGLLGSISRAMAAATGVIGGAGSSTSSPADGAVVGTATVPTAKQEPKHMAIIPQILPDDLLAATEQYR